MIMTAPENKLLDGEALVLTLALGELEGWTITEGRLTKQFRFADFPRAIAFMTEVAFTAERLEHHPNWSNVYNRVDVELWSHDLGGVSALCVELARAMNRVAK
jgi:4a-hydroxytetrahydrobiopterin dehydratase